MPAMIDIGATGAARPRSVSVLRVLGATLVRMFQAYRAIRGRRALLQLSDAALKDIGLDRGDLMRIGRKPVPSRQDWLELNRVRQGLGE